jgi:hypothetical protein
MKLQLLEDMHVVENTDARDRIISQELTRNNIHNIRPELLADIDESTEKIIQILK